LQDSIDIQLATVAQLLGSTLSEEGTIQEDVLLMQEDANTQSNLVASLENRIDKLQSNVGVIDELQQSMTTILLALDEDKLLYTDDDGDLTLEGILNVSKIVADEIVTGTLVLDDMQIILDSDAAIAGHGTFQKESAVVDITTAAVTKNSLVFVTPYNAPAQALSVSEITCNEVGYECEGFVVSRSDDIDEKLEFSWFIVNEKQDSSIEVEEENEESAVDDAEN
jgi:hypothetical protein